MKRLVSVSVSEFSTKWPSYHYIHNYDNYDIECTVVSSNRGIFVDKYILKLGGTAENI